MLALTVEEKAERDAMILQWQPLAIKAARRFRRCRILWADLKQEAMLALIHAVDGFDPGKAGDAGFVAYASQCINNSLVDMCARQLRPFRIPAYLNKAVIQVLYGKAVSAKRAKAVAGLEWHRVPFDDFDRGHIYEDQFDRNDLMLAMAKLSEKDREILVRTMGLHGATKETHAAIGKERGLSRTSISVQHRRAMAKVRRFLESEST